MPKYNFMISKAVDLVARKLIGMDPDSIARVSQILSEEAQMISDELQHNGQNVDSEILAARLEGVVARMKYAAKNQEPDPSPHEFPIFNVSHNPVSPYPNPINHLYDKRYKEAYATYIKPNEQAPTSNDQPTSPPPISSQPKQPTPSVVQPKQQAPPVVQPQQQTPPVVQPQQQTPPVVQPKPNANNPQYPSYPQGQYQQQPRDPNRVQNNNWQYVNPYAAYYQQQAAIMAQASQQLQKQQQQPQAPPTNPTQPVRHSASSNDLNHSSSTGPEKIRVRVINDNSSSSLNSQGSFHRKPSETNDKQDVNSPRKIYAQPGTDVGAETMLDLFQIANKPRPSSSSTAAERVIIIDRREPNNADNNNPKPSGQDRYREFEIRATPPQPASSTAVTPTTSTPSASSNAYVVQQPSFYPAQQVYYPQMKVYSAATPQFVRSNNVYPYMYYRYN